MVLVIIAAILIVGFGGFLIVENVRFSHNRVDTVLTIILVIFILVVMSLPAVFAVIEADEDPLTHKEDKVEIVNCKEPETQAETSLCKERE
jgi:hypothetical protein